MSRRSKQRLYLAPTDYIPEQMIALTYFGWSDRLCSPFTNFSWHRNSGFPRGGSDGLYLLRSDYPKHQSMPGHVPGIFFVRPAWAHSCGCKSRRELITANEVKRNCVRATERGEEAWSINCEPMDKNRIEGAAEQGEWAKDHEALVIKAKWRKSGGCAVKECVLTWGDLASCLKGRRGNTEREVSRGRSSCRDGAKGQTRRSALRHVDV